MRCDECNKDRTPAGWIPCARCGAGFLPRRPWAKYCGKKCSMAGRMAAYRKRVKAGGVIKTLLTSVELGIY